ncbi:helix-turn-helix transcriptional regulator [Roseovarius aestuarii]|nr:helix-turn-helix transcriptional regulator [Roseovarius aestuarii]
MAGQLREISPDRFETSEYYARYYAATKMIDELGTTIRVGPQTALHLSLGRSNGNGRYRAGDVRYFRMLAPIVMNRLRAVLPKPIDRPDVRNVPGLIERYRNLRGDGQSALSRREAEIAALIVQGHSSRAVGLQLGISDQTVKVHRRNIYKKLKISSQNELFSFLIQDKAQV